MNKSWAFPKVLRTGRELRWVSAILSWSDQWVGKSSIGRFLAQQFGISFVDTDVEIERVSRMTIPDLFVASGELEFRALEKRVLNNGPVSSRPGAAPSSTRARASTSSAVVFPSG
ncbi:hypothetical protein GGD57_002360 [Rhizobium esperanzae]|uniref:Shikimate kinase n=1 Tax=Rhizobium esperanzae TaxID=1967781 RepID=A0A7W6R2S5_9HYPH|nr:hypothetical protein [Rhizobium esperanzae]